MTSLDLDVAQLRFVDLGGYRMAYREWGDPAATEAVILIHGITSSSLSWVRVAPRLAAQARVIAVDLQGHGDSDKPASVSGSSPPSRRRNGRGHAKCTRARSVSAEMRRKRGRGPTWRWV